MIEKRPALDIQTAADIMGYFSIIYTIIVIKRRRFLKWGGIVSTALLFPTESCKKVLISPSITNRLFTGIVITNCNTQKGAYLTGEDVKISFDVKNTTTQDITLTEIHVLIKDISNSSTSFKLPMANKTSIAAGGTYSVVNATIWTVPGGTPLDAFGIYIGATMEDNSVFADTYSTFFRVADQTKLLNYTITNSTYQGLNIQCLNGGLSAEYTVGKAAENLSRGIAHSWFTSSPGSGPNSVYSTPGFLDSAIDYTINYYDQTLGVSTTFDTVIISTGVASVPYLSRVMKAPVLPLQFLVSADTVKEIIGILIYNTEIKSYSSFSTLGYDDSIAMAVAWIKLLDIPQQYIDFLNRHSVKNIVFAGTYGANGGGETTAKKIVYNSNPFNGYNNGDLYLMYPGSGTTEDVTNLYTKIKDLSDYDGILESNYRQIADWESGLVDEQMTNFTSVIKQNTGITNIRQISAPDSLTMYNLATYLTLTFMQKNQTIFSSGGPVINGVILNPYLLAHPVYETKSKCIPMLFWQGNNAADDVSRLVNQIQQNINAYFPEIGFNNLSFWINTSMNFGGFQAANIQSALLSNGLTNIKMNNNAADEVWDPRDGMNSVCELAAEDIILNSSPSAYQNWDSYLIALNVADLDALANRHNNISVIPL